MIGIVDYEAGNMASISNALTTLGIPFVVGSDSETLLRCDGIILPGVGAAPGAMDALKKRNLVEFLKNVDVPLLGICLGMQLLYESSDEGNTKCLGILKGNVKALNGQAQKVPHMGWNEVEFISDTSLNAGIDRKSYFYFAHSYFAPATLDATALSECGIRFSAMIQKENYFGVQFHPEKSGAAGLNILKNFETICTSFQR